MFYFSISFVNRRLADGTVPHNNCTIGIRWDLDKKFNWRLD